LQDKIHKSILIVCWILGLWSIWLHFCSPLDNYWQTFLYTDGHWLIDADEPVFKFFFYNLPKVFCIVAGVSSLVLLLLVYFRKLDLPEHKKIGLLTFFIMIAVFPAFIGFLKDVIRQPCPRDLVLFGGSYAGGLWDYFINHGDVRCFPGGHASAPFSCVALVYMFREQSLRRWFMLIALPLAFLIGFYQMAKGAHFVSDTLFTAAFAWIFISFIHGRVKKIHWSKMPKKSGT
jgi:membrane-associated PAP2 superfamily phosphatase